MSISLTIPDPLLIIARILLICCDAQFSTLQLNYRIGAIISSLRLQHLHDILRRLIIPLCFPLYSALYSVDFADFPIG